MRWVGGWVGFDGRNGAQADVHLRYAHSNYVSPHMSSLIFYTDSTQALVATDTLAV